MNNYINDESLKEKKKREIKEQMIYVYISKRNRGTSKKKLSLTRYIYILNK